MAHDSGRPRWFVWLKWVIVAVVIAGLVVMLRGVLRDLQSSKIDLRELRWEWLVASCVLYGLGTIPGCIYWHRVLESMGQRPAWGRSLRAFFFSQLGKYVPGKAMVVVMRTSMISGPEVRPAIAVTSVFVETLTWMAVGATIGSLLLALLHPEQRWLAPIGIGFAVCAFLSLSPPVLGRALQMVRRLKGRTADESEIRSVSYGTIASGWLLMSLGWTMVGASMWAVLFAVPGPPAGWNHFGLAMECVTLSIVIGIASLIPGGLGVRELVIVPLLTRDFGAPKALTCAILIRLVWLISEVAIVGIIQLVTSWRKARAARVVLRRATVDSTPNKK